ncbi:hypothetical protein BC938DRAFT_478053 [Jimgerdemannia flammicorona]|uniref:Uncharacterized protein n=1 Tax=Jimgerdemannia flammicorona TaxID=994334 RepID=A0A433QNG7_9FUNG|nr:hypothetical protein BC938DRAFT_478053 [Jimgerdemannia flammicorona]
MTTLSFDPSIVFAGICTNESCKACSFKVVIGWGQRNFDFFYDEHRCVCPLCREYVRPFTCGFNNTWWSFCGSKKVGPGHAPQSVSGVWKYAGDKHHYFDEKECGEVDWGRLKILVSSKDPRDARSEF